MRKVVCVNNIDGNQILNLTIGKVYDEVVIKTDVINDIGNIVNQEPTKIEEVDKESSSVNKPTSISNPPDKKRSRRYDPEFYKEIKSW